MNAVCRVTAVEVKSSVSEDKVKRQIAKQYRKRRYKKVVFLVIARPWRARELQDSMLNFGKKLVKALHSNKHLNKACSGLFQLLSDWDG
nr:hypothetical protein BaRGS_030746 [Batillaria attramentaria]